jgi:hypothetical protein
MRNPSNVKLSPLIMQDVSLQIGSFRSAKKFDKQSRSGL